MKYQYTILDKNGELQTIDMITGAVVTKPSSEAPRYAYNHEWGEAICEAIRNGESLRNLAKDPKMPSLAVMNGWLARNPEFKKSFLEAKVLRAEYYRDVIAEQTEEIVDRDSAHIIKAKVENYKWLAEKDDPNKYGANIKIDAKHSGAIGFYALKTGVPREENKLQNEMASDILEGESTTIKEIP